MFYYRKWHVLPELPNKPWADDRPGKRGKLWLGPELGSSPHVVGSDGPGFEPFEFP